MKKSVTHQWNSEILKCQPSSESLSWSCWSMFTMQNIHLAMKISTCNGRQASIFSFKSNSIHVQWGQFISALAVFTKINGHDEHVWWEISQIWIEYIKPIRQMSDEPWSGMGVDHDEKNWNSLQGGTPRKFWNKNTHLEHFDAFWSVIKMVLGDKNTEIS